MILRLDAELGLYGALSVFVLVRLEMSHGTDLEVQEVESTVGLPRNERFCCRSEASAG